MRARAPGKLVLSGAYSVLAGAPALVAAVDRYVEADTERVAALVSPEVGEAIARGLLARAPWIDAEALREPLATGGSRKLGLGSSAAIIAASLGAALAAAGVSDDELPGRAFAPALACHRAAQRGGSGIDVAASCHGGVLVCRVEPDGGLAVSAHPLVAGLIIEAFACPGQASTTAMLAAVRAFAERDPDGYRQLIERARAGAEQAVAARSAVAWVAAVGRQLDALGELGREAGIAIVTAEVAELDELARSTGGRMGPSGAGGGDIALWLGTTPCPAPLSLCAETLGLRRLDLGIGARGLHRARG